MRSVNLLLSRYVCFIVLMLCASVKLQAQSVPDSLGKTTATATPATDSTVTATTDTTATAGKDSLAKPKEIKKIDDKNLHLPEDLVYKIKHMGPDELLVLSERFMFNERRKNSEGETYEVTVTVRLGFSQDMITGIVKETPLYFSSGEAENVMMVKIPVEFCCTNPIDSLHKKKHCGKMSELNDLEDNEHCKTWEQKQEAVKAGPSIKRKPGAAIKDSLKNEGIDFGKPVNKKGKDSKKKGAPTTVSTDSTQSSNDVPFGVPPPAENKKGKKKKGEPQTETPPVPVTPEAPAADTTKPAAPPPPKEPSEADDFGKPKTDKKEKKKSEKKKKEKAPAGEEPAS